MTQKSPIAQNQEWQGAWWLIMMPAKSPETTVDVGGSFVDFGESTDTRKELWRSLKS